MTRPLWTRPDRSEPDTCEILDPLISPYADGMVSPEEALRIESHLPACPACRQSLLWMQATRRSLASRPIALPPPDLRARIARSIAAADAAPLSLRPARVFTLRPAYAAAASLSLVAALVSYGLMHTRPVPHVIPPSGTVAKALQPVLPAPFKGVAHKHAVKAVPPRALLAQANLHHAPDKVASRVPDDAPDMTPTEATPPAKLAAHVEPPAPKADTVKAPLVVRVRPRVLPHKKPVSPRSPLALMASRDVPVKHSGGGVSKAPLPEPKHLGDIVASSKVPSESVAVHVDRVVVTPDAPPAVRTASNSSDLLGSVHAYLHVHQTGFERNLGLAGRTAIRTAVRNSDFSATNMDGAKVNTVSGDLR